MTDIILMKRIERLKKIKTIHNPYLVGDDDPC